MKEWFETRHIEQTTVATVLGCSPSTASRLFNGVRHLTLPEAKKLHDHFGIPYEVMASSPMPQAKANRGQVVAA